MRRIPHRRTALLLSAGLAIPLLAAVGGGTASAKGNVLNGPSPVVGTRFYLAHPSAAPAELRARFQLAHDQLARAGAASSPARRRSFPNVFNNDTTGLPQDEESVSSCTADPKQVIGGTNDFRGLLDPAENFTGWYYSLDGGRTLTNEGLLPPVAGKRGVTLPSGGDPVTVMDADCSVFAASLNYPVGNLGDIQSGVGVYRSSRHTLATCPQGGSGGTLVHPQCWPTRRAIDIGQPGHFLDKEWMDVGRSGSAGQVVWIAYGDLSQFNAEGNEESGVVKAVRCTANLAHCTKPIVLSSGQKVAEYPDVTIGPDGRTYITWGEFFGKSFLGPTQRAWVAVAEPGSTTFTRHPVYKDEQIIRGRETLHANTFRTGTMFLNTVTMVGGRPRIMMVWASCLVHALGDVCEEPRIRLMTSDDLGRTWSGPRTISAGGDNYMPNIDRDPTTGAVVSTWYTSRFDPVYHNRQDVELVRLSPAGAVLGRTRVTRMSNEPEADPFLRGDFIGDYFEASASGGVAYVHYNANARHERLLGDGVPVPQQDNYLVRVKE